jgi:hypothetical protein
LKILMPAPTLPNTGPKASRTILTATDTAEPACPTESTTMSIREKNCRPTILICSSLSTIPSSISSGDTQNMPTAKRPNLRKPKKKSNKKNFSVSYRTAKTFPPLSALPTSARTAFSSTQVISPGVSWTKTP